MILVMRFFKNLNSQKLRGEWWWPRASLLYNLAPLMVNNTVLNLKI
jgi:hypothetical protein